MGNWECTGRRVHKGHIQRDCGAFQAGSIVLINDPVALLRSLSPAMTQSWINHYGEVVVKVLGNVLAQLCGYDCFGITVVAMDAKVNVVGVIEDVDLGFLRCWLSLEWLPLPEVANCWCRRPKWIIQRPIQPRRMFRPCCHGHSGSAAGA